MASVAEFLVGVVEFVNLLFCFLVDVAARASFFLVVARKLETRHGIVVETEAFTGQHDFPAVGRVAAGARLFLEDLGAAAVVRRFVAAFTCFRLQVRELVVARRERFFCRRATLAFMALEACDPFVFAGDRVVGVFVVVEGDVFFPVDFGVAMLAGR